MIDFFHKGAEMTKKVTGIAKLKGAPKVNPRPPRKITRVGTFLDEEDVVTSILLEVSDTPEARAQGLMGRKYLPPICGMLFEGLTGPGHFWMKNSQKMTKRMVTNDHEDRMVLYSGSWTHKSHAWSGERTHLGRAPGLLLLV